MSHFGDESFQAMDHTGSWYWQLAVRRSIATGINSSHSHGADKVLLYACPN